MALRFDDISARAIPRIGVALVAIVFPLERLKVLQTVGSVFRDGLDMVDFPSVF